MATGTTQSYPDRSKRIVVCCDGTWVDALGSDTGPLSNVTRISRVLQRICSDGKSQIIFYHPGVGTGPSKIDMITGGVFGLGVDEDIREGYNFVCANYVDGDEIILIGFSRGAFTARSIADMIASLGLLTTEGLDHFYPIFLDYENIGDGKRDNDEFLYHDLTPYHGETGKAKIIWESKRKSEYKQWLKKQSWTRDTCRSNSSEITIKAVAVWDTVGSLGIPPSPVVGIRGSAKEWKFTNTQISSKVENAFQALALDEPRAAFRPALWERLEDNTVTNLRQVWFPGSHGNVGGGWYDQQIANISLAWMCDQLTTVGVEFSSHRLTRIFIDGLRYNVAHPYPYIPPSSALIPDFIWRLLLKGRHPGPTPWATSPTICPKPSPRQTIDTENCTGKDHHLIVIPQQLWAWAGADGQGGIPRSWALGQTRYPDSWFTLAAGTAVRRPGLFCRVDPDTNEDTDEMLLNTNENIHSCVRVRLACQGMGMDDRHQWPCQSLSSDDSSKARQVWRLAKSNRAEVQQAGGKAAQWWRDELAKDETRWDKGENAMYRFQEGDGQWKWVFDKGAVVKNGIDHKVIPQVNVLPEEPMVGYWERHLLALTRGQTDVWRWAEGHPHASPSTNGVSHQ